MRKRRKLFYPVFLTLLVVGGVEVSYRLWLWGGGRTYRPSETRAAILQSVSSLTDPIPLDGVVEATMKARADEQEKAARLHPYYGFEETFDLHGVLEYFQGGDRLDHDYVILIVGGSVAALCRNHGSDLLTQIVSRDPDVSGKRIKVLRKKLYGSGGMYELTSTKLEKLNFASVLEEAKTIDSLFGELEKAHPKVLKAPLLSCEKLLLP